MPPGCGEASRAISPSSAKRSSVLMMRLFLGVRAVAVPDVFKSGYGLAAQPVVGLVGEIRQVDYFCGAGLLAEGV